MVHSETPIEIWNCLPQELRSYLIGQLDMFMKNSKGCYLLSKLERKMVYQFLTYISQIVFLSHAVFIGGFMANLYDRVMEKKEDLAYCMYYFVVFDHGLSRMAKLLNRLLNCEKVDHGDMLLVKSCVTLLVNRSIEMGAETKADWENTVEKCNPEIWKEVMFALRKVKGRRGNRKVIQSLDDILMGNKECIKQGIRLLLVEIIGKVWQDKSIHKIHDIPPCHRTVLTTALWARHSTEAIRGNQGTYLELTPKRKQLHQSKKDNRPMDGLFCQ